MSVALISVSDKSGVVEFARALVEHGYELSEAAAAWLAEMQGRYEIKDISKVARIVVDYSMQEIEEETLFGGSSSGPAGSL